MKRLTVLLLSLVWLSASLAQAADRTWYDVRSPHFRVLTDGSEKEGREVARAFEQIRFVFATLLPNLKPDPGIPLLIVAPNDLASARRLFPKTWERTKSTGFFRHGSERQQAMVRLDVLRS